jgi:hypothetical protein
MKIPEKVLIFLEESKMDSKENLIKTMVEKFNYKKSTANQYYSTFFKNRNVKEMIFNFFNKNPEAIESCFIKRYAKEIGVSEESYIKYKLEYIADQYEENRKEINFNVARKREKFKFDDSRL